MNGPTYPIDPHGLLALPAARLATRAELAELLGLSPGAVKNLCRHAHVPYAKIAPGAYLFDVEACLRAIRGAA
jgi:hypothetical protein